MQGAATRTFSAAKKQRQSEQLARPVSSSSSHLLQQQSRSKQPQAAVPLSLFDMAAPLAAARGGEQRLPLQQEPDETESERASIVKEVLDRLQAEQQTL